jgi:hypothetical protein
VQCNGRARPRAGRCGEGNVATVRVTLNRPRSCPYICSVPDVRGSRKEVAIPRDKTPPKWAVPFFTIVAIILGATFVYDVVRGEPLRLSPHLFQVGALVVCAWLAFDSWRKRRKDADAP